MIDRRGIVFYDVGGFYELYGRVETMTFWRRRAAREGYMGELACGEELCMVRRTCEGFFFLIMG